MKALLAKIFASALVIVLVFGISPAKKTLALSSTIVISQVYGGGGNTGAPFTHDFVELFNRGTTTVSLAGMSVQYASATGTGNFSMNPVTALSGSLAPGQYYLVQLASNGAVGSPLPTPDATGTVNMSGTAGKVILANTTSGLACNGGSTVCTATQLSQIVDLVGWGGANFFETAAAPTLTNSTAAIRAGNGCTETDNNSADFTAGAPAPRNTASPLAPCAVSTNPTGTSAANPDPVTAGNSTLLTVTVTPGTNPASTGLAVTGDLTTIGGSATQAFFDNGTNGDVTAGDNVFSYLASVPGATSAGAKSLPVTITDAQARSGSTSISLTVQLPTPAGGNVVISQVYGGGGNFGATLTNDFIELYNRSSSPVNITGWSVQYASSAGTSWSTTALSGTLQPGQYYLVQQAAGSGGTTPLPTPDASGSISMSATTGKVALVNSTTALTGSGCPFSSPVVDFVGYGSSATCFEGSGPTGTLSNTTAALRNNSGATDTDNNSSDFTVGAPNPRNSTFGFDQAPAVTSTSPANGDIDVAVDANISITFSEAVNVSGAWFSIACTASGTHTAAASGGPSTFTLNPDVDFASSESCTVTISAAGVTDQDAQDPPDNMAADYGFSFSTQGVNVCTLAYTPAYAIQGSGLAAAITGVVTTQGVVVGDYEGPSPTLRGFYVQDLAGDGDPATSDAIFVFNGNNDNVSLGDVVRVTGSAGEFQDQTQISSVSSIVACGTGSVTPVDVTLPVPSSTYLERFEGMLVRFPQTLYVTEHFQLGRFGQVVLSSGGRLQQPTNVVLPGAPALALQAANNLNRIILDDALQNQNPDPILFGRGGNPLSASNTLRGGDTATNTIGVLTYTWAGNVASGNAYRIRPFSALGGFVQLDAANLRPASPSSVGGTLQVSALNLLNFFNTFNDFNPSTPGCFPSGNDSDCRGANSAAEFTRQYQKTVAAILAINPDVLGVNEIENDGYGPASAIQFLVDQLNAATAPGTYAFIDFDAATGQANSLGTDAIKVGLIYKPGSVTPVGTTAVLNSTAFVNGGDPAPRNRATFAQAFAQPNGAVFIVSVNHLKSKGSACSVPDAGDGQGNCNIVRTNAANELAAWLASDPTGTGDGDILIMGDLNSYAKEDPITALKNSGYTNLIESFLGPNAYSFVFDGQWGYLDHALASSSMVSQVTGVTEWHINADEPGVLDYNVEFKSAGQITSLYAPDQFRVSDHDPVIVGLDLNAPPVVNAGGPYSVAEGGSVSVSASGSDPNGDVLTYAWDMDNNGTFETPGQTATFSAAGLDGPSSATIKVRVTDTGGLTATASATVNILNAAPTASSNPTSQTVQYSDPISNVTITGSDVSADLPLSISTQWQVDSGSFTGGLPAGLSLSAASCGSSSCSWTLSGNALTAPGTYIVRATIADKDEGESFTDITIFVTQEDARTTYTGALFASTTSTSSSSADVTLAATIQDISATAAAAGDVYPGDIRNATVTFIDRDTNATLCTAPVGLVSLSNLQTGTATCTWSVDLGSANSISVQVGVKVGGYYLRNSTDEDSLVTVSKPLSKEFITGGGYILLQGSAGQIAGDDGTKLNFGFNVAYGKNGRNLKGNVTVIVRRLEADGIVHVYQIKGNAMTSLSVQSNAGTAVFNGKANIQDITDPLNPISIDGNATLQIEMKDRGEPGSSDTIGITLWNKNGGLWFASKWNGVRTVQQTLNGGNLIVR